MLEKIGTAGFETLSKSDPAVLDRLKTVLKTIPEPIVYEIGVGIGATTVEMAELLNGRGKLHLFSRQSDVRELADDLLSRGFGNVAQWGSANRIYSGYHFELADGFVTGRLPKFDLAYLDGGHVMHLDGPAICILKELANDGAYLILDDVGWSLEQSPTMSPTVRAQTSAEYDPAQIAACHVDMARRCFLETDPRFVLEQISRNTAVYRRVHDPAKKPAATEIPAVEVLPNEAKAVSLQTTPAKDALPVETASVPRQSRSKQGAKGGRVAKENPEPA